MGRAKRDATLENKGNRLKLEYRHGVPRWSSLAEGEQIGYYRHATKSAGTWLAKWRDKATGERRKTTLGIADDYADADGIRILDFGQAQKKAQDWFDACAQEARRKASGGTLRVGPYTVAQAMEDYRLDCEHRGVKSMERQTGQVNAHILPTLGNLDIASLTKQEIKKWLNALATSPRRVRTKKADAPQPKPRNFKVPRVEKATKADPPGPPSTPDEIRARRDTANRVFTILKAALNLAHEDGHVSGEAPWREVKPFRDTTTARVRFLSIEDQVRLVRACPNDFQRLVKAALYTGARFGELTHITVAEYNREAQTLFIPGYVAKSSKARHIFLTGEGQRFFEALTAGREFDELMFLRDGAVKRRCRKNAGQSWAKNDQQPYMKAACNASGIARLTFHELRHTAASTWIAAGMDLILVARQLGHSDTRMVEKHYGHLCPDAAAARFRALAPELGLDAPEKVSAFQIKTS